MATEAVATYRYLNRDNCWRGFRLAGVELGADGALRLAAVPAYEGELPSGLATLGAPGGPAGVAVGPDGSVYFSDPAATHRIFQVDACDDCAAPVLCAGGVGDGPARFHQPRGLLYLPARQALVVADSANHRLQFFRLPGFQLVDVWGRWGKRPGEFRTPVAVAADAAGNIYVVDNGVHAREADLAAGEEGLLRPGVQKFDPLGQVVPSFAQGVRDAVGVQNLALRIPSAVAVGSVAEDMESVFVLDAKARQVFVFSTEGTYRHAINLATAARETDPAAIEPMGLVVAAGKVCVGDNAGRRILCFGVDGNFLDAAVGYVGPVAALGTDRRGGLWVHPGWVPDLKPGERSTCGDPCSAEADCGQARARQPNRAGMPLLLGPGGGHVRSGFLCGGPFANPSSRMEQWHRIRAHLDLPGPGTHAQLFVYSAPDDKAPAGAAPESPASAGAPWTGAGGRVALLDLVAPENGHNGPGTNGQQGGGSAGAGQSSWVAVPPDAPETLLPGRPGGYLWIGLEFHGEGRSSPELNQIRVDFDHQTLLAFLPAIYQEDRRGRQLLARFLTLFQGSFEDREEAIERLPSYFDPRAVPASSLDWLAGWLALDLDEDWAPDHKQRAIAEAFSLYAWRGTPAGLRRSIKLFTGAEVEIEEPIRYAQWWSLAAEGDTEPTLVENSLLGVTTMLAPAEPQGAVLGTSAVLDSSHLITDEEYGAPLFTDVAHQFTVRIYQGAGYSAHTEEAVRAVIERERPAHTAFQLCVVEPELRIGLQARVGIDTIVAGPPLPLGLDAGDGTSLVLGGDPPGHIGTGSRLGVDLWLGGGVG